VLNNDDDFEMASFEIAERDPREFIYGYFAYKTLSR
jgi:hypothetical protein